MREPVRDSGDTCYVYKKYIYISDIKALVSDACYYIKNKAISRFW